MRAAYSEYGMRTERIMPSALVKATQPSATSVLR